MTFIWIVWVNNFVWALCCRNKKTSKGLWISVTMESSLQHISLILDRSLELRFSVLLALSLSEFIAKSTLRVIIPPIKMCIRD